MKQNNEIIEKLKGLEPITYDNGHGLDTIHPGQIFAQYVEMDIGSKAYQNLNMLLNECLTLNGCESLLKISAFHQYAVFYPHLKEIFDEAIILVEFESIVELVEAQLKDLVKEKELKLNAYLEQIVRGLLHNEKDFSRVDDKKALNLILEQVAIVLSLRSKTAEQLSRFDLHGASKDKINSQIKETLSKNMNLIMMDF